MPVIPAALTRIATETSEQIVIDDLFINLRLDSEQFIYGLKEAIKEGKILEAMFKQLRRECPLAPARTIVQRRTSPTKERED